MLFYGLSWPKGFLMPQQAYFFLKYFWFIGVPFGVVNTLIVGRKISSIVKERPETLEQAKRLVRGYLLSATIPPLLLGILQMTGGFDSCLYFFSRDYGNIYVALSWLVLVVCWVLMLYWVLLRNGARIIVTFRRAFFNVLIPASETAVKALVVLCVCAGLTALLVGIAFDLQSKVPRPSSAEPVAVEPAHIEPLELPAEQE